jgi:hypothetical protein
VWVAARVQVEVLVVVSTDVLPLRVTVWPGVQISSVVYNSIQVAGQSLELL